MRKLGKRQLVLTLAQAIESVPEALADAKLVLTKDGTVLTYTFDAASEDSGIAKLLKRVGDAGIQFKDLQTHESSLEDIFVNLVHGAKS